MALSRTQVKEKLVKANEMLEKLNEDCEQEFQFRTSSKYIPGYGTPSEIGSKEGLVKLYAHLNKDNAEFDSAARELGVEIPESDDKIQGFPKKVWIDEIKRKLTILTREDKIEKLERTIEILKENLSDDDRFAMDMDSIEDGLGILDEE